LTSKRFRLASDTPARSFNLRVDTGNYDIVTVALPGSGGAMAAVRAAPCIPVAG
jgi:hypothetical protein